MHMHVGISRAGKPNVQKGWCDKCLCETPNRRFNGRCSLWILGQEGPQGARLGLEEGKAKGRAS